MLFLFLLNEQVFVLSLKRISKTLSLVLMGFAIESVTVLETIIGQSVEKRCSVCILLIEHSKAFDLSGKSSMKENFVRFLNYLWHPVKTFTFYILRFTVYNSFKSNWQIAKKKKNLCKSQRLKKKLVRS